jgi:hypothetical protein
MGCPSLMERAAQALVNPGTPSPNLLWPENLVPRNAQDYTRRLPCLLSKFPCAFAEDLSQTKQLSAIVSGQYTRALTPTTSALAKPLATSDSSTTDGRQTERDIGCLYFFFRRHTLEHSELVNALVQRSMQMDFIHREPRTSQDGPHMIG